MVIVETRSDNDESARLHLNSPPNQLLAPAVFTSPLLYHIPPSLVPSKMASLLAFSWEDDDVQDLQAMAIRLRGMLSTDGKEERETWDKLHGVLGQISGYLSILDRNLSTGALLRKLKEKMGPQNSGHSDLEDLLQKIMAIFKDRVGIESVDASLAIKLLKNLIIVVAKELNMLPLCDSIHTEMIQEYTFHEDKVTHLVKWSDELSAPNAPYTVISIIGAQSSGKSYLLNQLFGSNFPVMNAAEGRKQTTRGILISRCIRPSLLVLDVEGFDGIERGQDTKFEKQAALFALTTSDIMMVNISLHDVGREQGGGATLFKTIFEERIKLPPGLTKIVVVVRNYDGATTLDILAHGIVDNLEKMWESVHLQNKEHVIFKDYIEVKVVALPEKKKKSFRNEVTKLRKLLSESNIDLNRSARVPVSSFSISSKELWEKIKKNKRLDLPSHKEMIAKVYCQEMVGEGIKYFASHKDYKILTAQESPRGFKEATDKLLDTTMAWYDVQTDMYDAAIRKEERVKLKEEVMKRLTKHCQGLIRQMREKTSTQFKDEFVREMKTTGESLLGDYRDELLQSYRERFDDLCKDLKLFDSEYLHKISGDLTLELQSYATYKILGVQEELHRKEVQLALQRADKDVEAQIVKFNAKVLETQRVKEESNRAKEKLENELKLLREDAERENQKLLKQQEEENRRHEKELEKLRLLNNQLEAKLNKSWCSIM